MGSPANLTLGPQVSTVTSAIETTLNCAASSSVAAAEAGHRVEEVQKLAVYLRQLQEERGKIEAFKRELPLCMQLLDGAIETTKQRVTEDQCSPTASLQTSVVDAQDSDSERSKRTPILENFMPLKRRWEKQSNQNDGEEEEDQKQQQKVVLGRPAWMGEAQLWTKHSPCMDDSPSTRRHMDFSSGIDQAKSPLTNARLMLSSKHRQGGAFVPFNRERQLISPPFSPPLAGAVPDAASLSLSTSAVPTASQNGHTNGDSDVGSLDVRVREQVSDARVSIDYPAQTRTAAVQPQRKARRCWSPELHRRFVSALQQLGGSQATPKQIRELMKVDGLTNDEVKSHLQKYRLHTRRSSPSPSPSSHAPQLLILGWVPPECSPAVGAASQASTGGECDDPPANQQEHTPPQSLQDHKQTNSFNYAALTVRRSQMMLELFLPQSSLGPVPGKIRNGKNGMSCPKAIDSVSDKTSRRASFLILRKRLIWGLALSLQSLFCFEYETNGYFIVTCNWPKVTASTSLGIQESMSKQPCPTCGRKIH